MASAYISVSPIIEATPGFSFGRQGACTDGTYLQVDGVPSNLAGRIVPFESAVIDKVFIVCQETATFDIEILKRNGSVFTLLTTVSVLSARTFTQELTNVEVALGDELVVKLVNGSASNIIVGLIVKGF